MKLRNVHRYTPGEVAIFDGKLFHRTQPFSVPWLTAAEGVLQALGYKFSVEGLGFKVEGFELRVWSSWCRVEG